MKEKIYIAGPISGREKEATEEFSKAEIYLKINGFEVLNPMRLAHDHDKEWKSYMVECLQALLKCDAVYMLRNWRRSKGALLENRIAVDLGLTIIFQET